MFKLVCIILKSNAKVERFHRTLHDVLSKKLSENQQTWDLFLNQALAANLMKPRQKYQGEKLHQIALQEQHKSFTLVRKHLKKAKKHRPNTLIEEQRRLSSKLMILSTIGIIREKASLIVNGNPIIA